MTKILAILILSSGFNVAVETKDGFVERSFQNSREGVSDFLTFAEPFVKSENLKFCAVSTVDDSGAVMRWIAESGLRVGFLTYPTYQAYTEEVKSDPTSAVTVANACVARYVIIK
jgi:hypothetical protein